MQPAVDWESSEPWYPSVMGRLRERQAQVATITPTVLAFLFGFPDSASMKLLTSRRRYFDIRSGDIWDLFFPGYYHWGDMRGGYPVGAEDDCWGFSERAFDELRRRVEGSSGGRWYYSGGEDLVVVCGFLVPGGEPTVDWASTQGGRLGRLDLAQVVERLTRDIEQGLGDAAFGVGDVVRPESPVPTGSGSAREVVSAIVGDILGAVAVKASGLG
jgi:hypothetical protein